MKTFIVYQMQVDSQEKNGFNTNFNVSTVIRKVEAETKEEAIGKFVLNTSSIVAFKKLNIDCIELSELISL